MSTAAQTTHRGRERRFNRRNEAAAVAAVLAFVAVAAFVFLIEGAVGTPRYTIRGMFASANGIEVGSPVRISGVDVGAVSNVAAGPHHTTVLSMTVNNAGRPVHADATMSILPRLILEGNFYIDLEPGSPDAPPLRSGSLVPETQTTIPVQFDQFLDTFTIPTRDALQSTIKGLAQGFGGGSQHTPSGAAGYRATVRSFVGALPAVGAAAQASLGTGVGDLHHMILSLRDLSTGAAAHPAALSGLIDHFDRLMGDLALEERPLADGISSLDAAVRSAPPTLEALDRSLPAVGKFAAALDPALRASPTPLRDATALLAQFGALAQPPELPALLRRTDPLAHTLPGLERLLLPVSHLTTRASDCLSRVVVPTLDEKVPDGALSTGDPAWLDGFHMVTGITSVTGGFDGNGAAVRTGIIGSASEFQGVLPGLGAFAGIGPTIQGVRPTWLGYGVDPPFRPDAWCDTQPVPDLAARSGPAPAWAQHTIALSPSRGLTR